MNPIRRELLNGLFVLVVASLLSVAFEAFQVNFNVQLWVLILTGVAIAVSGYVVFESLLSADARDESTRRREEEWLKRVGTPALLDLNITQSEPSAGASAAVRAVKAMSTGSDLTLMVYIGRDTQMIIPREAMEELYGTIVERVRRGTIREYKRILCFDHDVLANDHEMKSGILRVGEGPGSVSRVIGEHCRWMLGTNGCFLYMAPVIMQAVVGLYGRDKAGLSFDTLDPVDGKRKSAGVMTFSDPPDGEIIEQFRQIVRATERRMVAVREIRFPEDEEPTAQATAG